ncbi:UNVERIFIED_CONTAM: hypothetical protein GTU68_022166 [Idotea baltica]|nr:hypothetical protein [Idotea baltica]
MDPHAVNSAPVLGFLNNVYEGLVRRGKDMAIEPALATAWEPIGEGEGWRFTLRQGVTFHDGSAFTAEDVLFSYQRASDEASDTRSWFAPVSDVKVVDDFTVDILTSAPNPIFPDSIANWMMVDRGWATANDAALPNKDDGNYATLNANGTGAFKVTAREPGLRTVLEPHDGWWGEVEHNVTRAEFTPIQNPATAVAALLSGDVDLINPLVSPAMRGFSTANNMRPAYDVEGARALMAEAGYADGFSFGLKCPNDRYLNDEAVCQAVVGMLAQIGITAELDAMPVRTYWPELREDNFDMYLLGWSPGTFDAEHPIRFLASTPNIEKKLGSWNFGGYSNARIDTLLPMIQSEIDDAKRQAMLDESAKILQDEVAYVPLYVQPLVWGTRDNIALTQRPDNFFILRWVSVN